MKVKIKVLEGLMNNSGELLETKKSTIINCRMEPSTVDSDNITLTDIENRSNMFNKKCYRSGNIHFYPINWWNKQKLLWMYKKHYLQKEENIRYIINIFYLSVGIVIGILNLIY
jgi:hypothetical protein